jgi:hypothetical protein
MKHITDDLNKIIAKTKKNISIFIQVPLDERTYEAINCYKDFGQIVVSTWDNEDLSLLDKAEVEYDLVLSSYPIGHENFKSGYYEFQTSYAGADKCNLDYICKFRSDELYPDLDKFILNFLTNQDKIITTDNGFWKPLGARSNHFASFAGHLYLCKSNYIKKCLKFCRDWAKSDAFKNLNFVSVEQTLGYFFGYAMGYDFLKEDWKEVFRKKIYITPCLELKNHLHSGQSFSKYKFRRLENYPYGRPDNHDPKLLYRHSLDIL